MHCYTAIKHELTIDLCDSTIEGSTEQNYMNNLYFKKQENNKHKIQNSGYLRRDTEVDAEKEHPKTLVTFILLGIVWQVNATGALCIANILRCK